MSKNVFLFLLHLKWIVLGDEVNIEASEKVRNACICSPAWGWPGPLPLLLFSWFSEGSAVNDCKSTCSRHGKEQFSPSTALLQRGPAQCEEDKYFDVKLH